MEDMETVEQYCELCTQVGAFSQIPTFQNNTPVSLSAGRQSITDPQLFGVTANFGEIQNREIINGRYLTALEVERSAPIVVLGYEIAKNLFPQIDPIGKSVSISGHKFRVVGVLKKYGTFLGQNLDNRMEIPVTSFNRIFGKEGPVWIVVKVNDIAFLSQAQDQARVSLRARHHRRYDDDDGFSIMTTDQLVEMWKNFSAGAFAAMIGIASIALVVGGIVIMNIMLVSVVERTSEIGLRKSLGARNKDIRRQFLMESIILAATGGLIGILLGAAFAKIVSAVSPLPSSVEPGPVIMALLMASSVGLVSGMWPALKAARLDPIEALRSE